MIELMNIGNKMYRPLNPDQQRHIGQISFLEEEDPQFLTEAMEVKDNPPDPA